MFHTTAVVGLALTSVSSAVNLFGLFDNGAGGFNLNSFDSTAPGGKASNPVTGLAAGEVLSGIDYRPNNQTLYAFSASSGNVYTVSPSGAATLFTNLDPTFAGAGSIFAFDFNPMAAGGTLARIISDAGNNRVLDSVNGGYFGDVEKTPVFYAAGDANEGQTPNINHIAYDNNIIGSTGTQQYGIDTTLGILVTVANNLGTLETVGSLGLPFVGELGGFDIDGETNTAFLSFQNGGFSNLYTVDLATGAATFEGPSVGGIVGLTSAPIPEPSSVLLLSLTGLGLIARRRR